MEPELSIKTIILGETLVETTRGTSDKVRVAADRCLDWLALHSRVTAMITFVIRDVRTIEYPPLLLYHGAIMNSGRGGGAEGTASTPRIPRLIVPLRVDALQDGLRRGVTPRPKCRNLKLI